MSANSVLVNSNVRLKVVFFDQAEDGSQVSANIISAQIVIKDANNTTLVNAPAVLLSGSEYYYDFVPTQAGTYSVTFTGVTDGGDTLVSTLTLYANNYTSDYRPTVTLRADETITFAPDLEPLYLDPEELISIFPDASLIEIGEMIYRYSLEIKEIYGLQGNEDGSTLPFTILEYIKAASACELSRTYGFGGDDELSLKLADLEITNRSAPRTIATRSNATTWCQIAASLRREVLSKRVSMRGVLPKGMPNRQVISSGKLLDPQTGRLVYLSDRELYGPGRKPQDENDPAPDRSLRQYD
jgi:hypothetical protein